MSTRDKSEAEGTKLLRQHGFRADGSPVNETRPREVPYGTLSPSRLASLREVANLGGGIHRCQYGNRTVDPAADFPENLLTQFEHLIEVAD